MTKNENLLSLMNQMLERAKRFTTENFINQVKQDVNDYNANPSDMGNIMKDSDAARLLQQAANQRYKYIPPLIFINTEAAKSDLFDRTPDIMLSGRGQEDTQKSEKVEAIYNYLKELLDLESFSWEAGHWFVLSGFTGATVGYKTQSHQEPMIDEMTGEPMVDEMGEIVMREVIDYDDPTISVDNPLKTYYSPASEFDYDARGVDYRIIAKPISTSEAKKLYNDDEIKADYKDELDDEVDNQDTIKETHKSLIYHYCGTIPEEHKEDVENWDSDTIYHIAFIKSKILDVEEKKRKSFKIAKWYSHPNTFFGFGFGKIGRPFQKEKSIRTGQRMRLADVAAFPKYTMKNDGTNKTNPVDLKDPRENQVLLYESEAPNILQPGNLADVVTAAQESAESDAQAAFGLLDVSATAQQSTVDTATGQTIFAEASARRMRLAKKIFMKFYREVVVELFEQCKENWTEDKVIAITDEFGNEQQVTINKSDLADIDFAKDLKIDIESISVNKDVVRAQIISLYDKVKDDPSVDRRAIIKEVMRKGFEISDPDRFLNETEVEPGTQLVNLKTGETYMIDEGGQLVTAEQQQQTAEPTSTEQPPVDQSQMIGQATNY